MPASPHEQSQNPDKQPNRLRRFLGDIALMTTLTLASYVTADIANAIEPGTIPEYLKIPMAVGAFTGATVARRH